MKGAVTQRLAAILAADVAGYSRLMEADEKATVAALDAARIVFREQIQANQGRVVDTAGDSVLATFETATGAVRAAIAIQEQLAAQNEPLPEARRMRFRIGINVGEIIEKPDGTIYGSGVNVAARLQGLAGPGTIAVSSSVRDHVRGRVEAAFADLGEHEVKNIAEPVRAWRVVRKSEADAVAAARPGRKMSSARIGLLAAVLVAIAGIATWQLGQAPEPAPTESEQLRDPVLALPTGPSIAVLPFTNLGGDPEQDYFTDGITEDIITALSRFRDLFVIARNSTFQYKGRAVDVKEVGRDLGVRYVLEGSVRTAADTIRVTAQLVDAETGAHLWADTFDRDLTAGDLFAVQDEITSKVVGVIGSDSGVIARAAMVKASAKTTDSLDVYDCVLRARLFRSVTHTEDAHERAMACIERAVALDPDYGDALAWRAYLYSEIFVHGWEDRVGADEALAVALDDALRAVEMDPTSQMARTVLAYCHFYREDYEAFMPEAERAIALNPNNAGVLAGLGSMIRLAGEPSRGVALVRKAISLEPHHPDWYHFALAGYHYDRGEYDQALAETLKINMPTFWATHAVQAQIYARLDRTEEAHAAAARLLELDPDFAQNARTQLKKFFSTGDALEGAVEGLRLAGVEVVRSNK